MAITEPQALELLRWLREQPTQIGNCDEEQLANLRQALIFAENPDFQNRLAQALVPRAQAASAAGNGDSLQVLPIPSSDQIKQLLTEWKAAYRQRFQQLRLAPTSFELDSDAPEQSATATSATDSTMEIAGMPPKNLVTYYTSEKKLKTIEDEKGNKKSVLKGFDNIEILEHGFRTTSTDKKDLDEIAIQMKKLGFKKVKITGYSEESEKYLIEKFKSLGIEISSSEVKLPPKKEENPLEQLMKNSGPKL